MPSEGALDAESIGSMCSWLFPNFTDSDSFRESFGDALNPNKNVKLGLLDLCSEHRVAKWYTIYISMKLAKQNTWNQGGDRSNLILSTEGASICLRRLLVEHLKHRKHLSRRVYKNKL